MIVSQCHFTSRSRKNVCFWFKCIARDVTPLPATKKDTLKHNEYACMTRFQRPLYASPWSEMIEMHKLFINHTKTWKLFTALLDSSGVCWCRNLAATKKRVSKKQDMWNQWHRKLWLSTMFPADWADVCLRCW